MCLLIVGCHTLIFGVAVDFVKLARGLHGLGLELGVDRRALNLAKLFRVCRRVERCTVFIESLGLVLIAADNTDLFLLTRAHDRHFAIGASFLEHGPTL